MFGVLRRPGVRRLAGPPVAEPLTAEGVTVRLGARDVLTEVDCALRPGEVLALVGPNGAGKSTLLQTLAGDLRPRAGAVRLGTCDVHRLGPVELARRRAVLPQQQRVAFPFTVREVVQMGRSPWPRRFGHDEAVVDAALAATECGHLAGRRVTELSGGERQRVALARVLAQEAPLLLLDEPTAGLDLHHQELVLHLIRAHARAGGSVCVVLHDLSAAAWCADRVVLLDAGRLRAIGPPACVFTPALLRSTYHHEVEVFRHPRTGHPVVAAVREPPDHRHPGSTTPQEA